MSALIINAINKQYELNFNGTSITGEDIVSNMAESCKKLLGSQIPQEIYVLTGPGSFTSTRVSVLFAKTLSMIWQVPLKACSLMDCFPDKRLILSTGTKFLFIYDQNQTILSTKEDTNLDSPFTTNLNELSSHPGYNQMPDLIPIIAKCAKLTDNPQPCYSIKPAYLKTETEITAQNQLTAQALN